MRPGGWPGGSWEDGSGDSTDARWSRRAVLLAGAGLCALAVAPEVEAATHRGGPGHETLTKVARQALDPRSISVVRTSRPWVALTFDDGPDPRFTPDVLDILRRHDVRATFFVIGRNVQEHPELARRIVTEGHRLANHTLDHVWLDRVPDAAVTQQLSGGRDAIAALDAAGSRLVRPPRGWTSRVVAERTESLGMRTAFWSVCLEASALGDGPAAAAQQTCRHLRPGAIVLAHDGGRVTGPNAQDIDRGATVEALPYMLQRLRRAGLQGVPLQDLVRG